MTKEEWYKQLIEHLEASKFRSSFHLKQKDIDYINEKGMDTIRQHAKNFIAKREATAIIPNDGKQTPTKGRTMSGGHRYCAYQSGSGDTKKRTSEDDKRFAQSFEKLVLLAQAKKGDQNGAV